MTRAVSKFLFAAVLVYALPVAVAATVAPQDTKTDRIPLVTVIPDYPEKARRERIEGEVQVCFNISRRGRPQHIAVRRSSNRLFNKGAVRAVRKSTWVPLPAGENTPGIKACRTFRFSLEPVTKTEIP